jgi:hypothetical protein
MRLVWYWFERPQVSQSMVFIEVGVISAMQRTRRVKSRMGQSRRTVNFDTHYGRIPGYCIIG